MIKPSSWAIDVTMFTLQIFQNMMAMINAFQVCMIKVGCGIGGWDMLTWTSFPNSTKMNLLEAFSKRQSL